MYALAISHGENAEEVYDRSEGVSRAVEKIAKEGNEQLPEWISFNESEKNTLPDNKDGALCGGYEA